MESNAPVIYKFLRDDSGKRTIERITNFKPYFYISDPNGQYNVFDGSKCSKIYTDLPEQIKEQRDRYTCHYEADVRYNNRYLTDCVDVLEPTKYKCLYLDIEVDNSGKIPRPEEAQDIIICIGVYDNLTDSYSTFIHRNDFIEGSQSTIFDDRLHEIFYYKNEKLMLEGFINFFKDSEPDITTGWNLISFDMLYLLNRLINLEMNINVLSPIKSSYTKGTEAVIKGVAQLDMMQVYRKLSENQEESYTLDNISKKNLGEGKTEDGTSVRQLWKNDIERLITYNTSDVMLTRKLEEKLKFIDFLDEVRRTCFCQYEDTMSTTKTLDSYILHMFHNKIVFPTKIHKKDNEKFEGAFVETWAKGIYENVAVFDLKSLYPSTIVSLNLSLETIDNGSSNFIEANNYKIDQTKKGFIPEVIEHLWKERAKYKNLMKTVPLGSDEYKLYDNRQKSVKILLNGLYGQTAYPGSRFFDIRIADTTTYIGRNINKWSRDFLTELGFKVLYADTDSAFCTMEGNSIDDMLFIKDALNESFDNFAKKFGITKHNFEIEFQKVYRKIFFGTAKKRYSGQVIWKEGRITNSIDSIGFEVRRSDSSKMTRNMQSRIFEMILKENKTKEEVIRYIGEIIDKIRKGDYKLSEIGIPKGISKDLADYGNKMLIDDNGVIKHTSSVPINVRAARYAEQILKLNLSSKPKMIYISSLPEGLPKVFEGKPVEALCFDDEYQIPAGVVVDTELMLEKLIKNKLEAIFDALGWSMRELDVHWIGKTGKGNAQESLFGNITDFGRRTKFNE